MSVFIVQRIARIAVYVYGVKKYKLQKRIIMSCDIHLRVEAREKINPYPNDRHEWHNVDIYGEFSSCVYGMFARMADVRSCQDCKYRVQFEPRGLPDDLTDWATCESFYMYVTGNKEAAGWGENYCLKENAEKWVERGYSKWVDENHRKVTNPDHHSHSWLNTQELRQCFDDCFKQEDGTYKPNSDYVEWLGLVSLCEGIESDGIHECRVVFAFDN